MAEAGISQTLVNLHHALQHYSAPVFVQKRSEMSISEDGLSLLRESKCLVNMET